MCYFRIAHRSDQWCYRQVFPQLPPPPSIPCGGDAMRFAGNCSRAPPPAAGDMFWTMSPSPSPTKSPSRGRVEDDPWKHDGNMAASWHSRAAPRCTSMCIRPRSSRHILRRLAKFSVVLRPHLFFFLLLACCLILSPVGVASNKASQRPHHRAKPMGQKLMIVATFCHKRLDGTVNFRMVKMRVPGRATNGPVPPSPASSESGARSIGTDSPMRATPRANRSLPRIPWGRDQGQRWDQCVEWEASPVDPCPNRHLPRLLSCADVEHMQTLDSSAERLALHTAPQAPKDCGSARGDAHTCRRVSRTTNARSLRRAPWTSVDRNLLDLASMRLCVSCEGTGQDETASGHQGHQSLLFDVLVTQLPNVPASPRTQE
ncbi:hypothetical protein B0T19DRAFT_34580 [Cercophora scortea]|uniref:Uncharacterized protein n=1 Tax=Cercophora scortea TaxID=314031 RepID=A0AAE0J494_9PEZI|nr:hypothetical protein B0T19DRAFT_34580 [Cercophora scortea]